MSGEITAEMAGLVDQLASSGIPATMDPETVLAILAEQRLCALVGPPTSERIGMGARLDLDIPVHLACNPPGSFADWEPVFDVLPIVLWICEAEARPVALSLATATVPAYQMSVARSIYSEPPRLEH